MHAGRLVSSATAAVVVIAGLAGCSSDASKAGQPVAQATTTATTATTSAAPTGASTPTSSTTSVSPTTPASSSTTGSAAGGQTIAAVLAAFGSGPITGQHMPKADATWLARVQQNKTPSLQHGDTTKILNLMALVDEAAREKDTTSLARLCGDVCDPKVQLPLWQKPGTLELLSTLIEQGPFNSQGAVLPDFMFSASDTSFSTAADTAFGKAVGVDSPAAYFKKYPSANATAFQNGSGGLDLQVEWTGLTAVKG